MVSNSGRNIDNIPCRDKYITLLCVYYRMWDFIESLRMSIEEKKKIRNENHNFLLNHLEVASHL
jgi:hypothetical protein